jgi:hypothetical protein
MDWSKIFNIKEENDTIKDFLTTVLEYKRICNLDKDTMRLKITDKDHGYESDANHLLSGLCRSFIIKMWNQIDGLSEKDFEYLIELVETNPDPKNNFKKN